MSILQSRRGPVTILTINRPEVRNALGPDTSAALGAAFSAAEADPEVLAVVLTGAGDRAFCAGMDLKAFASRPASRPNESTQLDVLLRRIYPKPVIAAVNGVAVAAGFELMMACDLVVAAEHARFGIPEVKRGLVATGGGVRLPARLPIAVALELGLTGDLIDAQRALALGLVNRVVPDGSVLDEALMLAERVCSNGPIAIRATKQLMWETLGDPRWDHALEVATPAFLSEDAKEGARAFVERRPPVWKNR
jgi:enoyl-CoA hydratase